MHAPAPKTVRPRPTAGSRPRTLLIAALAALAAHAGLAALLFGGGDGAQGLDADGLVRVTDIVFIEAEAEAAPVTAAQVAALPSRPAPADALAEPVSTARIPEPAPAPPAPARKPAEAAMPEPATSDARAAAAVETGAATETAARPAPAQTAAAGTPGARASAGILYERRLLAALHAHLVYPRLARARGEQGEARLFLLIARDGEMLEHRLDTSSGFSALDAAALDTARRAAPLPPLPHDYPGERLALVVPISFALR